jgi:Kef-type K+ transport system membrane component KefB
MPDLALLLLHLSVILLSGKLAGEIFERLKQPAVIGEILVGLILGPSFLGYLSTRSSTSETLEILSQLGIILLLFLAGLTVRVEEFRRAGKPGLIVAASGVIVAFLLGFGVASLFGWTRVEAAFAGGVLMATSVGVTVRTLLDLGELHSQVGATILSAAVIDDVFGIAALSVLGGLASASFSPSGLVLTCLLMGLFFLLAFAALRFMPSLLERAENLRTERATLALSLSLALLFSALAYELKLAAITGAFFAGLALSGWRGAGKLREEVSSIGYGFLIPLFFVWCGVRTDLHLVAGSWLALFFLAICIIDKFIGCGGGALLAGMGPRDALRVGVGMMPRMEVALIIASVGVSSGAVGPQLLSMTVLVVVATSLLTPFLLKRAFSTQAKSSKAGTPGYGRT